MIPTIWHCFVSRQEQRVSFNCQMRLTVRPTEGSYVITPEYRCRRHAIRRYRWPIPISQRRLHWSPPILSHRVLLSFYIAEISGLAFTLLLSMFIGLKVVVMRRFDLEKWLQMVQKHKVTYAHVAPPISMFPLLKSELNTVVLLAKDPVVEKYDLSSLRVINSSSAPLKEDLLRATYSRLKIPVKQGTRTLFLINSQDME